MRNLKRALSLGLTAAMISGLMVMGSSAASYADVTSEQNQEAIEVLQAVGIMVGDENGNFNPDAQVTRNEMAVIMSNLMDYRVATYSGTSPFTDVPSWAEPYVAACWTNGITAGYSATTYGGSDTVTTAQAALMLMKALGYFQYDSDFGTDWQLATITQATKIDLFTDVDSGVKEAMTRNDLAQLVLNTLESGTVEAETDGSITVGDITITNNSSKSYSSVDRFGDPTGTGDTCEISFLKMSKDVLFKINIPDGQVAVRIEFWGLSNSSAGNWAYLCYLANPALPTPIVSVDGGQTVDGITGRDIMDNEAIKALAYPFSPSPVQAETTPVAVIEDPLGWYSELSFLYDGNNQVGANIVIYTVPEADLESYDPAKDQSIKNSLDQPESSSVIEIENEPAMPTIDYNAPMYNILGQPVSKDYKGVIIQKGHKFILQ